MENKSSSKIITITNYQTVRIPKSKNLYRTVYIVSEDDKSKLRDILPELEEIYSRVQIENVSYAFEKGKNANQV